ncbi:MAG: methylated-DNA-[protein]-cysteine S-methyltransferase [Mycobacterium sp.]|jgi:methylated-DNA-[protein]-cysteine S-methyltransferase|nr:methylated-DNA-[protein]-cysteine S-methyltransferase [Mycobacterium sp.]
MSTMTIARTAHPTRLGNLTIEASAFGLTRIAFSAGTITPTTDLGFGRAHAFEAGRQIDEYLAGTRRNFTVPIDWSRVSAFDAITLQTLCASTRYGQTISYGAIAQRMGRPASDARKIGGALARNPVLIIVPCHRVVAADGALTGYAGGLTVKRALLDLESDELRLAL